MEELVSIITPMYNAQEYIEQTIQSVLNQTYQNWEMIIVDDCSTDQSADIVKKYAGADARIRYILLLENAGVAQARNRALHSARGRYLAFLDSDDIWRPDKLRIQIAFMQKNETVFCYSACGVIDSEGKTVGKVRHVPEKVTYQELLKGNVIPCLTVLLDRKQLRQYKAEVEMPQIPHEDYAVWLSVLKQGITAYGVDVVLADYRVDRKSVSGNKWRALRWTWQIYYNYLGLGKIKSIYYFVCYVTGAIRKRI